MNYPYSSFLLETRKAKLEFAVLFQERPGQCPESLPFSNNEGVPVKNDQQPAANQPSASSEVARTRGSRFELRRNTKSPGGAYWMREDMGTHSFAWTLLLLGTFAAAQTEHPALWLLIGPAPFIAGYVVVAFLQRRFNLCAYLRGLRHQGGGRGCQCQCQ